MVIFNMFTSVTVPQNYFEYVQRNAVKWEMTFLHPELRNKTFNVMELIKVALTEY